MPGTLVVTCVVVCYGYNRNGTQKLAVDEIDVVVARTGIEPIESEVVGF